MEESKEINIYDLLTIEEQNKVIEFLSFSNMDINEATKYLQKHKFDLNVAIQNLLNKDAIPKEEPKPVVKKEEYMPDEYLQDYAEEETYENSNNNMEFEAVPVSNTDNRKNSAGLTSTNIAKPNPTTNNKALQEQDLHALYRTLVEKKLADESQTGNGVSGILKKGIEGVFSTIKYAWNSTIPTSIRGETPGGEQFLEFFTKNYHGEIPNARFSKGSFEENMMKAHRDKKPLLVYMHSEDPNLAHIPLALFKHKGINDIIEKRFILLGLLCKSPGTLLISKYLSQSESNSLAVFRVNLLDDIHIMNQIPLDTSVQPASILEKLRDSHSDFVFFLAEEEKIKKDVTNKLKREKEEQAYLERRRELEEQGFDEFGNPVAQPYYHQNRTQTQPLVNPEELLRLEENRLLRQQQEEEYKEVEKQILIQNEKKMQAEMKKVQEAQEKKIRKQSEDLERLKKKECLPEEPTEENVATITVAFRFPNGQRITRRFDRNWQVQILYDFIDTQEIQFEHTGQYDIIQPLPFLCLEQKNKTLGDYFENSTNELVHIREKM